MTGYTLGFVFSEKLEHVLLSSTKTSPLRRKIYSGIEAAREPGETPVSCLVRTCFEATCLITFSQDWVLVNQARAFDGQSLLIYATRYPGLTTDIEPEQSNCSPEWFLVQHLPKNLAPDTVEHVHSSREVFLPDLTNRA